MSRHISCSTSRSNFLTTINLKCEVQFFSVTWQHPVDWLLCSFIFVFAISYFHFFFRKSFLAFYQSLEIVIVIVRKKKYCDKIKRFNIEFYGLWRCSSRSIFDIKSLCLAEINLVYSFKSYWKVLVQEKFVANMKVQNNFKINF